MLLIVPYGIETYLRQNDIPWGELLIVPYGIETHEEVFSSRSVPELLIVPYGIETYWIVFFMFLGIIF